MKRLPGSLIVCFFVFLFLIAGCRGCPPRRDSDGPPQPPVSISPGMSPSPPLDTKGTVQRISAGVMAGDSAPLPLLNDDAPRPLTLGTQVSTDPNGEALLTLDCMKVFLFQIGKMTYGNCSKSESTGGNAICQTGGTAVYNSACAGRIEQIIRTPTVQVAPRGTWIIVAYLPDQQLTVTCVLKGSAEVRPVTNIDKQSLGESALVSEGQFYLTVPDDKRDQNIEQSNYLRQPKNVSEAPGLIHKYLEPWLDRIQRHAKIDEIPRKSYAFTADINCDCEHVEAGLLTRDYRLQCIRAEAAAWARFYETGELGKCDAVAQGPNARLK